MTTSPVELGTMLARQFERIVSRDGGSVSFLGVEGDVLRMAYRPGADLDCDDECVLPQLELQQLMSENLARRDDRLSLVVELVQ